MSEKNHNNAKVYVYSQQTKIKTAAICDRDQKVSKGRSDTRITKQKFATISDRQRPGVC